MRVRVTVDASVIGMYELFLRIHYKVYTVLVVHKHEACSEPVT